MPEEQGSGTKEKDSEQGFLPLLLLSLIREEKPISTGQMGLQGEVTPQAPGWLHFR